MNAVEINAYALAFIEEMIAAEQREHTPTVHYMPCPNHEAAIEVEGYCPCFDGLEIDWTKTDIWRNK